MNGRYDSITPTTPPDCHQSASVRPRPDYGYQPQPDNRPLPGHVPDQGYSRRPYRPGGNRPSVLPGGGGPIVGGQAVGLGLVCFGDGSKNGIASGTTWTWNQYRDRYEYGRYNETTTEVFDASLMVQTWNGDGRIRLPRSLIPPINSRGNNG